MYRYRAYGLGIASEWELPGVPEGRGAEEVVIRVGKGQARPAEGFVEATFSWEGIGTFHVREGREILVAPAPAAPSWKVCWMLLGPAVALLLAQRGLLVLHAGTVRIGSSAVAFLGDSGQGKSTLVAALQARGHALVADEVTAVDVGRQPPTVLPGVTTLRLWPDAIAALGDDPDRWPRVGPHVEKRTLQGTAHVTDTTVPLAQIYLLSEGPTEAVTPLQPQEAFMALVRHAYGVPGATSAHLRRYACLANAVAVQRLSRPRRLERLHDLARWVERATCVS